jgi:hypothetical protein
MKPNTVLRFNVTQCDKPLLPYEHFLNSSFLHFALLFVVCVHLTFICSGRWREAYAYFVICTCIVFLNLQVVLVSLDVLPDNKDLMESSFGVGATRLQR